jgi:hypothetical protein
VLVEPNRREKDLVKEEQTKTETKPPRSNLLPSPKQPAIWTTVVRRASTAHRTITLQSYITMKGLD